MELTAPTRKQKILEKFSIDVMKAKPLFEPIFKTINHSSVLPILCDILVSRADGNISFTTTDLENVMTVTMPDSGKDFNCIFPGIELRYLIKNSLDRVMDVSLSGYEEHPDISVKNKGFKLNVASQKVDTYPKSIKIEDVKSFTIDTKEIVPYLEKALWYTSNDDLRPAMTGVCFKDRSGTLHIAATDAHRLYWHPICKTPESYKSCSFIVSRKAVSLITLAFKTEKSITIGFNGVHLGVKCENKKLITRLLDCRYPDYDKVIPENNSLSISVERKEFISILKMCQHFTNKSTGQLSIAVHPDRLDISGGDVDFATDFSDSIPVKSTNLDTFTPFQFGVNVKFLIQGLESVKGEFVKIDSSMNILKAFILDDCVLIMPLMLNA